jgi:hypothetical protein
MVVGKVWCPPVHRAQVSSSNGYQLVVSEELRHVQQLGCDGLLALLAKVALSHVVLQQLSGQGRSWQHMSNLDH